MNGSGPNTYMTRRLNDRSRLELLPKETHDVTLVANSLFPWVTFKAKNREQAYDKVEGFPLDPALGPDEAGQPAPITLLRKHGFQVLTVPPGASFSQILGPTPGPNP
jgi:hypothetical protein